MNEERRKSERRVPPAVVEFAVEERQQLLEKIADQARQIERLNSVCDEQHVQMIEAFAERDEAMKARPGGGVLPERFEMEPYQTVDKGSSNYKAGFNAAIKQIRESLNSSPVSAGVKLPDDFVCDSKPLQDLLNATAMLLETPCPDSATYWAAMLANVEALLKPVSAGGVDERAAFEAWYLGNFYMGDKQCGLEWLSTEPCGGYRHQHPAEQWKVWQARAALAASAQSVPDGWKLVPVEPSIASCIIGSDKVDGAITGVQCAQVYRAMLAAAPSAGSQKEQGE